MTSLEIALTIALGLLALAIVVLGLGLLRERSAGAAYRATHKYTDDDVVAARSHSVATSKGTTLGQAAEHLAPWFPEIVGQFAPGDWRFLGSPVDFVVFDGLTEGQVQRVVLVEVKAGKDTRLNARQTQLSAAVNAQAVPVEWVTLRPPSANGRPRRRVRTIPLPPDSEDR